MGEYRDGLPEMQPQKIGKNPGRSRDEASEKSRTSPLVSGDSGYDEPQLPRTQGLGELLVRCFQDGVLPDSRAAYVSQSQEVLFFRNFAISPAIATPSRIPSK